MNPTPLPLPVRLRVLEREAVAQHFLALGPEDRRLRFGSGLPDELVRRYVERIDFEHDEVFAVSGDDLRLLGVVHVAFTREGAELGLSVLPEARGQGIGNALFERAVMHLRTRGGRRVYMHCLGENQAVMHLARKHGMRIVHSGAESEAHLELAPPTAETFVTEWMRDQRADVRQAIKHNTLAARRIFALFGAS